jgi:hypothetical protein
MLHENTCPEAEFMDAIGTKVLRVFLLALLTDFTPSPLEQKWFETGLYCKHCIWYGTITVKKAVELLDAPSKNTFLKSNKYDRIVEIVYLDTYVFFSPLCNRMRKFDIREVQ